MDEAPNEVLGPPLHQRLLPIGENDPALVLLTRAMLWE
jgi:hypothetical protein